MLSCIRLFCDPMDYCPPGSSIHGIFRNTGVGCCFLPQGSSPPRDHDPHSCTSCIGRWILYHCTTWEALIIALLLLFSRQVMSISFATPWTVSCQSSLSMGFPRQEYWSGLSFPSPGDLADPGSNSHLLLIRWILYHSDM